MIAAADPSGKTPELDPKIKKIVDQLVPLRAQCSALDTWPGKKAAGKLQGAIEILLNERDE